MITENYLTISGAYGRDYPSAKAAKDSFVAGKDFMTRGLSERFGAFCSIRDFAKGTKVSIRYKRDTRVVIHEV